METALVVVAVLLVVLAALVLFAPLELAVRCERHPPFRCRVELRWLFGLVATELEPSAEQEPEPAESAEVSPRKKRRRKRRRPVHVMAMLRTRGFLRGSARLAGRLLHAFRFRDVFVRLRAGFDDPADTGILCSWLMPAAAYLEARHPGHWDVAPEFSAPAFDLAVRGRVSVTTARLLWPVLAFGLSPSTLRGLIALRTGRAG